MTLSPEQALAQVMSGVNQKLIVSIEFTPHESDQLASRGISAVVHAASGKNGDSMLGEWQAYLVAGAVAELITPSGSLLNSIGWVRVEAVGPDGHVVDPGVGFPMAANLAGTQFSSADQTDEQITRHLTDVATASGLEVDSIQVLHPLDPAPIVILRLPESGTLTLSAYEVMASALFGTSPDSQSCDYEGYYLEIDSPTGTPLIRDDSAWREGTGTSWTSPNAPFTFPTA